MIVMLRTDNLPSGLLQGVEYGVPMLHVIKNETLRRHTAIGKSDNALNV